MTLEEFQSKIAEVYPMWANVIPGNSKATDTGFICNLTMGGFGNIIRWSSGLHRWKVEFIARPDAFRYYARGIDLDALKLHIQAQVDSDTCSSSPRGVFAK